MTDLVLRHLATDRLTLSAYIAGGQPGVAAVKSNLFLAERGVDYTLPDHYYRNISDNHFSDCLSLASLIIRVFCDLTEDKVVWRANRLHIHLNKFNDWHKLITRFPSLPLAAYAIYSEFSAPDGISDTYIDYASRFVVPNLGNTALLSPYHPFLDDLTQNPGLYDLHQHLSGTTEADLIWLQALERPFDCYTEFQQAYSEKPSVQEQFAALEPGMTPYTLFERLIIAAALRYALVEHLFLVNRLTPARLRRIAGFGLLPMSRPMPINYENHPLRWIIGDTGRIDSLPMEGLFHILMFRYLHGTPDPAVVQAYHLYLLLHGTFSQMIVQQHEQFGFDQFQRIAENNFRSDAEKDYTRRFRQIAGNNGEGSVFVEGRFAPKGSHLKNRDLIYSILGGYARYCGAAGRGHLPDEVPDGIPELRLVAHFIKQADNEERKSTSAIFRHQALRIDLEEKGKALLSLYREDPRVRQLLVGIDAASNELHAPPEVFAPLYRRYRREGFVNFTFHVGEDFVHLLSGLRRIEEAVEFLGLQSGNRLGHATAVGIKPGFWLKAVNNCVTISRLEWLDNLLFAHDVLKDIPEGQPYLERLRIEIERHAQQVYGGMQQLCLLVDSWKMRSLDPLLACGGRNPLDSLEWRDHEEWNLIRDARCKNAAAFNLYHIYQHLPSRHDHDMVKVDADLVDKTCLKLIQGQVLGLLHKKGIVIETMPTSNVRISFYRDHSQHHIWRWLKNNGSQKPTLCVASDDPGIFATNLYNEYAQVFQGLMDHQGHSMEQAMATVEQLAENSRRFRFQ